MFLIALILAYGPDDDDAAAAIAIANARLSETKQSYNSALKDAINKQKPLVVFVGVEQRQIKGSITTYVEPGSFVGYPNKCIIVSDRNGNWKATLSERATDKQIVGGEIPSVIPFRRYLRRGELALAVEDDLNDLQLQTLLEDMEPYDSAKMTQTTFRRWSGYITPSSRLSLENKWIVPGHLDGVDGWSSRLYRRKGIKATEFLVRQDPNDTLSAITWGRSYPDGAEFADILRNPEGTIFEIRVATKADGKWDRFIAYRNPDARPINYVRPKSSDCRSCHSQAGSSEYAGAAIPGADSIISDPIHALEYGGVVQGGFGLTLGR